MDGPKLQIYVCGLEKCGNAELYTNLADVAAARNDTEITLTDYCLGACGYRCRVEVKVPGEPSKWYAKEGRNEDGRRVIYPIGDDPVKTLITDNLPNGKE